MADPKTTWTAIVNGAAGGGRCGARSGPALERLRQGGGGLDLDVRYTERAGHATELAREAYSNGARHFLAVGGDGTTYEIINGIFPRPASGSDADADPVTIGFCPLGTGNSFLRDFGIIDAEGAIEALLQGRRRSADVVRVVHRDGELHYLNLMSLGFSAEVGALTNRRFKPFGFAGYGMAVVASVVGLQAPTYPLRVDGGPDIDGRPCTLLSFSNSRFTGGTMMMAPAADPGDGAVDVIRIHRMTRLELLRALPRLYRGTHVDLPSVEASRARRLEFIGQPETDCMIDGEVIRLALRSLEVLPAALEVVA